MDEPELIAFQTESGVELEMGPSPRWRQWMDATPDRSANRCLPLLMANECGWTLHNPEAFTATWSGGNSRGDVELTFDEAGAHQPLVETNFGSGIITWNLRTLFRTPPGWNLLARGPINLPKDGASPLEGLVESDWSVASFTMNWKLTRPGQPVRFAAGEPFCTLVPQRRGELERFLPVRRDLAADPAARAGFTAFRDEREDLRRRMHIAKATGGEVAEPWEARYFRGRAPDGESFPAHQTKLRLRPFAEERTPGAPPGETLPPPRHAPAFTVPEDVRFRSFRTGTIVIKADSGIQLELNAVAGRMLELLALGHGVAATARVIAERFGQPLTTVEDDVAALASQLVERGVLAAG